ncbi:HpcH/HpaI aldolase/citrate lyase family protein [Amycolatopsis umgeniensis]|uniref:Citrate lyase subunit beta/citryl-CoA lyase n=1 Tax=Amycolatopsis umgeniensis TaxID=336628 RepID=A0A841AWI0_9PSEU|nr:CoA ester lyase [Amycolatopsis umgeniensis]MBB5850712.1 citrate lyase subunit beta/citryl-CoA lyase [Amycolatopsis umgeniensis]
MSDPLASAKTFLFVPGHRPDRFAKAAAGGAGVVILDLEDAVGPDRKETAREHVRAWLEEGHRAVVRLNAAGTPWYQEDVASVGRALAVMLPKAEDPAEIDALAGRLPGMPILPLVETAAGIVGAVAICGADAVVRPAFGSVDLAAQLGVDDRSHEALRYARSALVVAAAAAGKAAPIDGVTTALDDEAALIADLDHAKTLGFTGKLCVHPRQVAVANRGLAPSESEIAWAREVVAPSGDGSVAVVDGRMVDRPVELRARAILDSAGEPYRPA